MTKSAMDDRTSQNKLESSPSSRLSSQIVLAHSSLSLATSLPTGGGGNIRAGSRAETDPGIKNHLHK